MADQPIDKATIVNRALVRLGAEPSFSLDGESFLSGHIDAVWPDLVVHCFAVHDWAFCRKTSRLTRLAAVPDNGWAHAFELPGDRIGDPLKVLAAVGRGETALRDFDVEGGSLFANVSAVWARCRFEPEPGAWEAGFRAAFTTALAARLAVPVSSDAGAAAELWAEAFGTPAQGGAGGAFGRLVAQSRAGAPIGSPFRQGDPLTDARYA